MTAEQQKWADEYLAKNPHHRVIDKGDILMIVPKDTTVSEEWRQMRSEKDQLNYGRDEDRDGEAEQ